MENSDCNGGNNQVDYNKLSELYSELNKRYRELNERHSELNERHSELNECYNELNERHIKLESDYSENTIIQSMNDMKRRYDELIESSVSIYKYNALDKKYKNLSKIITCGDILLDYNIKILKRMENIYHQNSNLQKIQTNLITLKMIIDEYEE